MLIFTAFRDFLFNELLLKIQEKPSKIYTSNINNILFFYYVLFEIKYLLSI